MKFNKFNVSIIHEDAVKILNERLAEYGITVEAAGGKYDDHEYTMKLTLSTTNESGQSQAAIDFTRYAFRYGLQADQLGSTFTSVGANYRITGLAPRRRTYPIEAVCVSGKNAGQAYIFRASLVKQAVA
jgi:hypothetical protein